MADESKRERRVEIAHVLTMDVVGYSTLLINQQSDLLAELTRIVRNTTRFREAERDEKLMRLPTGDGMVLVFSDDSEAPLECAIEIGTAIKSHPTIRLRMGIHSGPVNQVIDVNDRSNIAGAGIDIAQRVMDCGDAGHVLLSKRVADDLAPFPQWNPHLHDLGECEVKHGRKLGLVNFYNDEIGNPETPRKLKSNQPARDATLPARSEWSRPAKIVAATIIILLAIAAYLIFQRPQNSPAVANTSATTVADKSIAVLPFVDLSQAKDQEYFCDGISEEILDDLAKVEGLRVVARTSSFSFKGKNADVAEIAHKLGVAQVLEGSLRREGNRIRVTAQLINAASGFHLWSETYEREVQGVFAIQDEITHAITAALKLKLVGASSTREKPASTEAHDLYLQGVFFSNKSTEEGLRKSLDFFQQSLAIDPNSARAWAGIAKDWDWLADAYVRPLDAYPAMRTAALKAIALDERNADGHVYLAEVKRILDWDIPGAEAELHRALEVDPNSSTAHFFLALIDGIRARREDATIHMQEALQADPLSPIVSNFAAVAAITLGRIDEAIAEAKRTAQLDPSFVYQTSILAVAYREKGMLNEAIELFKKAQEVTGVPQAGLAIVYADQGRPEEARRILEDLKKFAATKYFPPEDIASVYVALGDKDEAFAWLDRACEAHSGALHAIGIRPVFRSLFSDPRFAAILTRIGLDPAEVLSPK